MIDIGDVSKRTGLAPSTLRYYDERGLISSVGRRGLRRTFEESTLAKLTLIGLGGGARFTLDEIATIMANAVIRQEKRNKTNELREGSSGLHCLPERPCHATEAKEKA